MFKKAILTFGLSLLFGLAQAAPVVMQDIPEIMQRFDNADNYRKSSPTLGRLPNASEIGQEFITWVSDGEGGVTKETTNTVTDSVVIARMPEPIAEGYYNEWLVPKVKWLKTYENKPLTNKFQSYKRTATFKAFLIDDEVLRLLGSTDGETAVIHVSWDPNGMTVYKDGYLANYEYGIASEEMKKNYEKAE
ncbi:hypothetical protein M3P05_13620 [Sansalvadorimonas sp. 2012CJ34-2]|uniref:Uncharacterized protein n=1 Tax=Parendozoicomonas callyspongiae TaxID=2942213 RepID=A0ABT0PHU3_9GAMM|nr:hypothetical protein [Sansalvadorimonas sp. 2012CJ34-2]MCL6270964.1 hypothetical protein [Sansalvadorimonas sp. 2012CJ34-2]